MDTNGQEERKVIETASATTSPDNENSGKFAYVVTAVTALALLLFALMGGIIVSAAAGLAIQSGALSYVTDTVTDGQTSPFDFDEDTFEDYLDQYYDDLLTEDDEDEEKTDADKVSDKSVSVSDALDFDLAPYLISLDGEVPASSYAGTPQEGRDFVRQMMSVDTDYSDQVRHALNAAASNEEGQAARIAEAKEICASGKAALDELEVPLFESVEDSSVRDLLGEAKGEAARRFELLASEIELLETDGSVDTSRLWAADDEVVKSCEKAAEKVIEAMSAASTH